MSLLHVKYVLFYMYIVSATCNELINYYRIQNVSRNTLKVDNKASLTLLDLRGSGVRSVESSSFAGMINLKSLLLLNNKIEWLPDEVFSDLINLEYLRLDTNEISVIKKKHFINLQKLNTLDLSHNLISKLEPGIFDNTNLKHLQLQYNRLTEIPAGVFNALENLHHLDISNNYIYQINKYGLPNNLQSFHIYANKLRYIDEVHFNSVKTSCLDNNPYICDCQMRAMFDKWKSSYAGQCWVPDCFEPKNLRNIRWDKLTAENFECKSGSTSVYFEENDIIANVGQSITFKCHITGDVNIPDIIFTYQNETEVIKQLQNNRRSFNVEYIWNPPDIVSGVLYKLKINNVRKSDSNIYRCAVKNVYDVEVRVVVEDVEPVFSCNEPTA